MREDDRDCRNFWKKDLHVTRGTCEYCFNRLPCFIFSFFFFCMFVQTLRRFNDIIVKERRSFIPSEARFTSETFEKSSPDKLGGCCRYYLTDKHVRSCHDCAIIVLCHAFLWNATFVIGKYIFSVKLNNKLTYFFSFFQSFSIHTSKSKRKIYKGRRYLVCIKQIYQSKPNCRNGEI